MDTDRSAAISSRADRDIARWSAWLKPFDARKRADSERDNGDQEDEIA